jgi:hypothetical protein
MNFSAIQPELEVFGKHLLKIDGNLVTNLVILIVCNNNY